MRRPRLGPRFCLESDIFQRDLEVLYVAHDFGVANLRGDARRHPGPWGGFKGSNGNTRRRVCTCVNHQRGVVRTEGTRKECEIAEARIRRVHPGASGGYDVVNACLAWR